MIGELKLILDSISDLKWLKDAILLKNG